MTHLPPEWVHLRTFRLAPATPAELYAARGLVRGGAPFADADPAHVQAFAVGHGAPNIPSAAAGAVALAA